MMMTSNNIKLTSGKILGPADSRVFSSRNRLPESLENPVIHRDTNCLCVAFHSKIICDVERDSDEEGDEGAEAASAELLGDNVHDEEEDVAWGAHLGQQQLHGEEIRTNLCMLHLMLNK